MPDIDLDAIDRRIVAELQADGRLTNVQLAERVGLSPSPCLRRVKRLEREGFIEGYRASLRRGRIGLGFSVFLSVKIDGHANDRALAFEKAVAAMPEVIACHYISGAGTFELQVMSTDLDAFSRFSIDTLLNLPNVKDIHTSFSLGEVKAGAALPLGHLQPAVR